MINILMVVHVQYTCTEPTPLVCVCVCVQSVHDSPEGAAGSVSYGGPSAGSRATSETSCETYLPDQSPAQCQTHQEGKEG